MGRQSCDESGIVQFNRIRHQRYDGTVFLYAFDLIELDLRESKVGKAGKARIFMPVWQSSEEFRLAIVRKTERETP
jgi:hypothetical protein